MKILLIEGEQELAKAINLINEFKSKSIAGWNYYYFSKQFTD
jgi:hypothetical protein